MVDSLLGVEGSAVRVFAGGDEVSGFSAEGAAVRSGVLFLFFGCERPKARSLGGVESVEVHWGRRISEVGSLSGGCGHWSFLVVAKVYLVESFGEGLEFGEFG